MDHSEDLVWSSGSIVFGAITNSWRDVLPTSVWKWNWNNSMLPLSKTKKTKTKKKLSTICSLYWMVERAGETLVSLCKNHRALYSSPDSSNLDWSGSILLLFQFSPSWSTLYWLSLSMTPSLHRVLENRTPDQGCRKKWSNLEEIGIYACVPKSGLRPLEGAAICVFNKTCPCNLSHFRTTSPSVGQSLFLHQHDFTPSLFMNECMNDGWRRSGGGIAVFRNAILQTHTISAIQMGFATKFLWLHPSLPLSLFSMYPII